MIAIILAAGIGARLGSFGSQQPKCLLSFGGTTLLQRHIEMLDELGIERILVVVGHQMNKISEEIERIRSKTLVELIFNPEYHRGNGISVLCAEKLITDSATLIIDADMLYCRDLLIRLVNTLLPNCILVDRRLDDSGEEIKAAALPDGRVWELGKKIAGEITTITGCKSPGSQESGRLIGESLGIYKFSGYANKIFTQELGQAVLTSPDIEYEDVINLAMKRFRMDYLIVDRSPWIEIDFPGDIQRARQEVWPSIVKHEGRLV